MRDINKADLPMRVEGIGNQIRGTLVECPVVQARQMNPNLHVLFVPDDPKERIERWSWTEVVKYFLELDTSGKVILGQ